MRYPHVARLRYRLEPTDETAGFTDPPQVERRAAAFYMRLNNNVVWFSLREHHDTEASARERVEPYLRSWEIRGALQYGGRPEFRFVFEHAEIIDLDPPPPGTPQTVELSGAIVATSGMRATPHVDRGSYPKPPDDFRLSEDVEVMWSLYDSYRRGRDRLLPMAYSCLSRLMYRAGSLELAANQYRISQRVLRTLSELTSTLGVGVEARKLGKGSKNRAPTAAEKIWIEAAVRIIIQRAGEVAYDPHRAWSMVIMNNLPKL
jgi:hypothetical protein